jgi:hypothetical protein
MSGIVRPSSSIPLKINKKMLAILKNRVYRSLRNKLKLKRASTSKGVYAKLPVYGLNA